MFWKKKEKKMVVVQNTGYSYLEAVEPSQASEIGVAKLGVGLSFVLLPGGKVLNSYYKWYPHSGFTAKELEDYGMANFQSQMAQLTPSTAATPPPTTPVEQELPSTIESTTLPTRHP